MKIINSILRPDPKILYLEPFFGCNYSCFFCIHGRGYHIRNIKLEPGIFEKIKPVIEKTEHIHITGLGEPLLNPHLIDYLLYFREKGKSYYINTNGSLIEDAHIDLLTTSRSELSVSLDAGDRETYQNVRHPVNWDNIMAGLKRVSQIKADRKSPYPLLYLTFHINALNLMSLKNIPKLAQALGIEAVRISWTILPESSHAYSIFANKAEVSEIISSVSSQLNRMGIQVRCEAGFSRHLRGCWGFSPMTFIGANGVVAACCSQWLSIGSLFENSFNDIWNGMPRRKISLAVLNQKPEGACRYCPQILGRNYDENERDFFKSDDMEKMVLAEKTKKIDKLPSLNGLDHEFRSGVQALLGGNLETAVHIFTTLDKRFPEFFEIKNNLAVTHYYLGNQDPCRDIFQNIKKIPYNEKVIHFNMEVLQQSYHPLPSSH